MFGIRTIILGRIYRLQNDILPIMATDPESNETPQVILHALQAGIIDPCLIAAMVNVKAFNIADALRDEGEVLFGPQEAITPPVAKPEGDAPST